MHNLSQNHSRLHKRPAERHWWVVFLRSCKVKCVAPSEMGRLEEIPGEELWRTPERRRERLVAFARRHMKARLQERGAGQAEVGSLFKPVPIVTAGN